MARTNRDDFSSSTKDKAAKRSAYRCAFCGKPTIGPSFENNEAVSNTGVAAHICAAAPGGKRYDPNMTPKQRKSIDNCVWMCQTHAHLIDTDEVKYSVMYHFAKLHPEVVKKAISDFRENIKIQITCDDEIQSED